MRINCGINSAFSVAVDGDIATGPGTGSRPGLRNGLQSWRICSRPIWLPGVDRRQQSRHRSCAQIRQMAKCNHHMAGSTTIKQFAAIAKKSALFVGSDSGAMHIASAVGTSVVALFGPSNPRDGALVAVLWRCSTRRSIAASAFTRPA